MHMITGNTEDTHMTARYTHAHGTGRTDRAGDTMLQSTGERGAANPAVGEEYRTQQAGTGDEGGTPMSTNARG
eukprot:11851863-Alexandrium_andersonii.AAC.1